MKYNKEFKRLLESDPDICTLPDKSCLLSYDRWKKRIKTASSHFQLNWKMFLMRDCEAADNALFDRPFIKLPCFSNKRPLTDGERLRISEINKVTLYKICKKIDKQLFKQSSVAKKWYLTALNDRCFRFLGGKELVSLKLAQGLIDPECPICFEMIDSKTLVVTACCHVFCKQCYQRIWRQSCPICRTVLRVEK